MKRRTKNRLLINYFFAISSERLQGLPAFNHLTKATIGAAVVAFVLSEFSWRAAALWSLAPLALFIIGLVTMLVFAAIGQKRDTNKKARK